MSNVLDETRALIESLVSRPRPTERVLSRPPFRFIHDLATAVNAQTGFIEGLLDEDELSSGSFKGAPAKKVSFLKKLLKYVEVFQNSKPEAKVKDIVGGHEVDKTLIFLQQLMRAAQGPKEDFQRIITQVKGGRGAASESKTEEVQKDDGETGGEAKEMEQEGNGAEKRKKEKSSAERRGSKSSAESGRRDSRKRSDGGDRRGSRRSSDAARNQEARRGSAERRGSHAESAAVERRESTVAGLGEQGSSGSAGFDVERADGSIERTQELFRGLIQRPTLKDKYLQQPPFRFIHDIVTETTRVTGLAEGVFSAEFADPKQIKTKEGKLAYLNQLLQFISETAGVAAPARASRVAAGAEPEKTNAMLQMIAMLGRCKLENIPIVGSRTPAPEEGAVAADENGEGIEAKQETPVSQNKEPSRRESDRGETKMMEHEKKEPMEPKAQPVAEEKSGPPALASNAVSRPQTARKRPPKIKDNRKASIVKPANIRATPAVGVMMEGDDGSEEEEEEPATESGPLVGAQKEKPVAKRSDLQGKLVRDIINEEQESKSEEKRDEDEQEPEQKGIQMGKIGHSLKKKSISGNSTSVKQLDQLKDFVQTLCQSVNPLGKCVDFVHEDYSTMAKELEKVSLILRNASR